MAVLTLGKAARLAGLGKTTIARAIKAGKLSAERREDGSYAIDTSELIRVYNVYPETLETGTGPNCTVQVATSAARPHETASDAEATARLAALEAEVRELKELLYEVRYARDYWKEQAARLALLPSSQELNGASAPDSVLAWRWPLRSWRTQLL